MPTIRQKLHQIFREHYHCIWFVSVLTAVCVGLLDYQFKYHDRDLIFWRNFAVICFTEINHFVLALLLLMVLTVLAFLALVVWLCTRPLVWLEELSELQAQKRYADFLLLRLIVEIDMIEAKYLRSPEIPLENFMLAYNEMTVKIQNFRKDARKLLTPNEVEVLLPIEDMYALSEEDERLVRRSRFFSMDISANEDLIRSLINP